MLSGKPDQNTMANPILQPYFVPFPLSGDISQSSRRYLEYFGFHRIAQHCASVAVEAKRIALLYGEDVTAAEIAAYLHDIGVVIPDKQKPLLAKKLDLEVLEEEIRYPMILHQKLSTVLAEELFGIQSQNSLDAVGCHTTLKARSSRMDKIVFVADKIAWDQDGKPPYLDAILAGLEHSVEDAAFCYLTYLWERRPYLPVLHPWMVAAYEELRGHFSNS